MLPLVLKLGYILYDQGYDVFLVNARGNYYSTGHLKYNRNGTQRERKRYWDFSWHEIGKFDLAASIDYVLKNTSHSQVHYVGHSQGTTAFFVLTSERPEYNDKILLMVAMAPPVFMAHLHNELLELNVRHLSSIEVNERNASEKYKSITQNIVILYTIHFTIFPFLFSHPFQTVLDWIGFYDFSREANNILLQAQKSIICSLDFIRYTQLCNNNFSPIVGNITEHVNKVRC